MSTPSSKKDSWVWTPLEPPGKEEKPVSLLSKIAGWLLILIICITGLKLLYSYLLVNRLMVFLCAATIIAVIVLYRLHNYHKHHDDRY